jgi:cellulose synthase operon protein C
MGGMKNSNDAGSPEAVDTHQRSSAGLPSSGEGTDVPDMVERHRQAAIRLLNEGQAARAFGELVRASRTMPMTPRLAATLVAFSLRAGTGAAAIALLSSALGDTRGETRRAVRLQLVRLLRRMNQLPQAIEALQELANEVPGDGRARRLIEVIFRAEPSSKTAVEASGLQRSAPRADAPIPWSDEDDTEPSRPLVPRREK